MSDEAATAQLLRTLAPLDGMKRENLAALAKKVSVKALSAGRVLFSQGDSDKRTVWLVNGRIEASGLAAAGHFNTVNGPIEVAYESFNFKDKVALETVNGSCRLTVPKNAGFELSANSVNGGTSCDLPVTLENSSSHPLRGTVGGGGPPVVLDSVNGSLHVQAK